MSSCIFYISLFSCLFIFISPFTFLDYTPTPNSVTYYVAADGTSEATGTSESNPFNLYAVNKKTFNAGDRILFKRGDTFYGSIDPKINQDNKSITLLSSYGDSSKDIPFICGFKIVVSKAAWTVDSDSIYKIDLTNTANFEGNKATDSYTNTIGYLEDKNKEKYFSLKFTKADLTNPYDFYCDGTYLYIKTKGNNPFEEVGELKLATRTNVIHPISFMKIDGLRVRGTGAHGIVGTDPDLENIEICNCIIEDIGGSQLRENTRYGNGIEFYETNIKNLYIHHNIIRQVYDVGFTIQGNKGSGLNVLVTKNVFVFNSQDSEIWESTDATGVYNYTFEDNVSIMPGRGWGYEARPDKNPAAHILFWGYKVPDIIEKTKILFTKNYAYNPRKIYYITNQEETVDFFRDYQCISSDNNHYFLNNDTIICNYDYYYKTRQAFIDTYKKDINTEFSLLETVNQTIVDLAGRSNSAKELRALFIKEEEKEEDDDDKGIGAGTVILIIILILVILGGLGALFWFVIKPKFLDKGGSYVEMR